MCQIIYRPSDHKLTVPTLRACAVENRDGWGIMYAQDGGVVVHNGLNWESFIASYNAIPLEQEMAIHFRWKTHGKIDLANTHPYTVLEKGRDGKDLQVMHNGVISIPQKFKDMSDTWHWVRGIVQPMIRKYPDLLEDKDSIELLENTVDGSRILFLDGAGQFTFLNRTYWSDDEGCEFSTTPPTQRTYTVGRYYEDYSESLDIKDFNSYTDRGVWVKENGSYIFKKYEKDVEKGDTKLLTDDSKIHKFSEGVSSIPYGEGEKYGQKAIDPDQAWFDESYFKGMSYQEVLDIVNDHPEAVADLIYSVYS